MTTKEEERLKKMIIKGTSEHGYKYQDVQQIYPMGKEEYTVLVKALDRAQAKMERYIKKKINVKFSNYMIPMCSYREHNYEMPCMGILSQKAGTSLHLVCLKCGREFELTPCPK